MSKENEGLIVVLNGKKYVTAPEEDSVNNCSGCAFKELDYCDSIRDVLSGTDSYCSDGNDIIYKELNDIIKGKKKLLIL